MDFSSKPVIACVHLLPCPGSPAYGGDIERIYESARSDVEVFLRHGVDALIVENFRDRPFHPGTVPTETTATLAAVTREVKNVAHVPVGVAVLRNDAASAMAIAAAVDAQFIRVNVHVGAVLAQQGLLVGESHRTLRLRADLRADCAIFADARVKHAKPLAYDTLEDEVRDLSGSADAIVVSGKVTGLETEPDDLVVARRATTKPVLVGTGATPENLGRSFALADGFIVGSYFKQDGVGDNPVDDQRVERFMDAVRALRTARERPTTRSRDANDAALSSGRSLVD